MRETIGIAQPVSVVKFGMPLIEIPVMAHSAFHDDHIRNVDSFSIHRLIIFNRATVMHRAAIVRVGNDAAGDEASDRGRRENLNFCVHELSF